MLQASPLHNARHVAPLPVTCRQLRNLKPPSHVKRPANGYNRNEMRLAACADVVVENENAGQCARPEWLTALSEDVATGRSIR
jgi:hypothetical protein